MRQYFNWWKKKGCILADEMGLGKTVQVISYLSILFAKEHCQPFLVVVGAAFTKCQEPAEYGPLGAKLDLVKLAARIREMGAQFNACCAVSSSSQSPLHSLTEATQILRLASLEAHHRKSPLTILHTSGTADMFDSMSYSRRAPLQSRSYERM